MKKKIIILTLMLCSGLIIHYSIDKLSIKNITTDSGFDTSYDSNKNSNQYSYSNSNSKSNSSSNSNSYSNSNSSSSSSSSMSLFDFIIFAIIVIVVLVLEINDKKKKANEEVEHKPVIQKVKEPPKKSNENKELLDEAYRIFVDTQKAWMNFDYNKLREVVTDELYNMYYSQLQTLSIKGEKNIMSNFQLISSNLQCTYEENCKIFYTINLKVSFLDYIVDSNNNVLRGNKFQFVNMEYELEFVKSINNVDKCPVCGAKLDNGITMCPYCRSRIQGVSSKMKLSNKKVLRQW